MSYHTTSPEEQDYLKNYDIAAFPRPSLTVDMAVFALMERKEENNSNRKDPEMELKLLLIKRGSFPYRGCFALPGGFCRPGETVYETALRELEEETSVSQAYLKLFDVFSDPHRDPRGWIISNAFLSLLDGEKYRIHAGTDAWEARWFSKEEWDALPEEMVAFDHREIVKKAREALRQDAEKDGRMVFDLMPETFTLAHLQKCFEAVSGRPLLTPNFRRSMDPYVEPTDEWTQGSSHRPARLFRRRQEAWN